MHGIHYLNHSPKPPQAGYVSREHFAAVLGTGYENTRRTRGNDEPGTAPYKSVGYFTRPIVFLRYPGFTRTRIPFLVA
jgi:hypothetical protein